MYLLDPSAIAIILRRFQEKSVEALEGKITLDLARYELGNVILKECALEGSMSLDEAASKAEGIAKILEIMKSEKIESSKDFREVMNLATRLKLTFYAASYLHVAKNKGLTLTTEDVELGQKAKHINIKTVTVSELSNLQPKNVEL